MICSTTRLALILATMSLVACAKQSISQNPVVSSFDVPVSKAYSSDVFFPYQKPVDTFTQAALISNPNDSVTFRLTYMPRESNPNLSILINGTAVTSGFTLSSNQLIFQPQPAPNAQIVVSYDVDNPNDVMKTQPVQIPATIDLQTLRVALNATVVNFSDLRLSLDSSGNYYVFDPSVVIFDYNDPYHIYDSKGLDIFVSGTTVTPSQ